MHPSINHQERGAHFGKACVAAGRVLRFYLLLFSLLVPAVQAQQGLTGNVRGGFVVPDYDPQTNRKRSVLYGDSAKVLSTTLVRISKLKIEVYNDQEKPEWIVESPDCLYEYTGRNAHSSSNLVVRAADGQFTISGEGFEWQPTNQCLVVSNRVRTVILKSEKGQGTAPAGTNAAAAFARQNLELTAQRLNFNAKQRLAEYLGEVVVREIVAEANPATPPYQIQCGILQVQLPQGGRGLESITALENVRIEQGPSRALGDKAVYIAANEVVELTGQARWQTDSAEGHGDKLLMERKENRFQTLGHAYAKLKEPAKEPATAKAAKLSRELEISAGRLIANLPPKGTNVFHLEAEESVELVQGDTHAFGDHARYDGSVTNGALQLSGRARWESPEIQGKADQLMVERDARRLKGDGHAWLRLQQTPRANVATNLPAVEVACERYELDNGEFQFIDHVKALSAEWQLACERMRVKTSGVSNRLESITAERGVVVEPSAAGLKGGQGWRLTCEQMLAAMQDDGRSLKSIVATNAVRIEPAGANKQRWTLACGRMTLGMAAGAGNMMERILAEQQVTAKQLDTNGTAAVWQMQSPQMEALMAPTNQLHQVTAKGGVVLEQSAPNLKGGPAIMRSQNVLLVMGASNQVDQVTAEGGVDLEQGLSRGRGERAVFSGKDDRVELHGNPWLTYVEPENKATNRPPRQLRVEGADMLVWYRSSNRFQGKGSYRFVPAGVAVKEMQLPGLSKKKPAAEVPVGPAGETKKSP